MIQERVDALMVSDLLKDAPEADRRGLAVEIMHRAGLDSDGVAARPIREVVDELRKTEPWWFTKENVTSPAPSTAWTGLTATSVAARAAGDVEKQRVLNAIEAGPNPWLPASFNMTKQALIANSRPDVAARLQAEAAR